MRRLGPLLGRGACAKPGGQSLDHRDISCDCTEAVRSGRSRHHRQCPSLTPCQSNRPSSEEHFSRSCGHLHFYEVLDLEGMRKSANCGAPREIHAIGISAAAIGDATTVRAYIEGFN